MRRAAIDVDVEGANLHADVILIEFDWIAIGRRRLFITVILGNIAT
jgi:hypothetical protein